MSARTAFLVGISFVVWALTTLKLDSRQDEFEQNMAIIEANIQRIDKNLRTIRKNLSVIEGSTATADATLSGEPFDSEAEVSTDMDSVGSITDCITDECSADIEQLQRERDR